MEAEQRLPGLAVGVRMHEEVSGCYLVDGAWPLCPYFFSIAINIKAILLPFDEWRLRTEVYRLVSWLANDSLMIWGLGG